MNGDLLLVRVPRILLHNIPQRIFPMLQNILLGNCLGTLSTEIRSRSLLRITPETNAIHGTHLLQVTVWSVIFLLFGTPWLFCFSVAQRHVGASRMKVNVAQGNKQIKCVNTRGRFKLPLIKNNPRDMQSGEKLFKDVTNKITVLCKTLLSQ
jgi:hypothetical protein